VKGDGCLWKDAASPAGHEFYAPRSFADLPDCLVCKWGTPVEGKCIDCGAEVEHLHRGVQQGCRDGKSLWNMADREGFEPSRAVKQRNVKTSF